jgi:hypothetical protein
MCEAGNEDFAQLGEKRVKLENIKLGQKTILVLLFVSIIILRPTSCATLALVGSRAGITGEPLSRYSFYQNTGAQDE